MNVEKIMTADAKYCTETDSLSRAAQIMWENDCGFVPVIAANGPPKLMGVLTDRDICMGAYTQGKPLFEIPVTSAMAHRVVCCKPSDDLKQAEALMKQNHVRRLPVVDEDGVLVGIVSINDLAVEAEREIASQKAPELTGNEVANTLASICEHRARRALAAQAG